MAAVAGRRLTIEELNAVVQRTRRLVRSPGATYTVAGRGQGATRLACALRPRRAKVRGAAKIGRDPLCLRHRVREELL